ncbi:MAG: J domain-containing protein [Cryomorphaceae bacterium]
MDYKDYYKVLGVDKKSSQAEIKKKFRKLAIQYHPDKNPDDAKAENKFKEVNEAYEVLGDADKRKKYDELGSNWKHYDQYKNAQQGRRAGNYQYSGEYDDFFGGSRGGGFSDFFNSFFGGGGFSSGRSAAGGGSPFGQQSRARRPATARGHLNLTFEEAFQGISKTLQVNDNKIRLNISPGAKDGQKLKVTGKGPQGGDLIIELKVGKSSEYKLDGLNLQGKVDVDFYTAALGGKATVKTPHGALSLNVTPGTDSGKKLRLKGKGMPEYGKNGVSGDFIAEIRITVPTDLSPQEKKLMEELRELRRAKV